MNRRVGGALVVAVLVPLLLAATGDRTLVKQLDNEVIALRQRIQLLEQHCGNDQTPHAIFPELVQLYAGTPVQVSRRGSRAVVTFQADDLFSKDTIVVREEAQPWLDLLATSLSVNATTSVMIVGHSDGSLAPGPLRALYQTLWEWNAAQANAVSEQLARRYGVAPGRITIATRGTLDPVATNDTPEGRAQNRRVVVYLSEGKFP